LFEVRGKRQVTNGQIQEINFPNLVSLWLVETGFVVAGSHMVGIWLFSSFHTLSLLSEKVGWDHEMSLSVLVSEV